MEVSVKSGEGQCGELPAGVTIDKREFRLAGAKLGQFSLGEVGINSTPEFTQILSEAAKNKVVQSVLTCNAIELAGVSHDAEMVAYYIEMQDFLSTGPSVDDRIKWKKAFPFPKATQQEQSAPQESLSDRLVRTCKQPLDGLNRQPQEFVPIWLGPLRQLHREDFFRESLYTLKCLEDAGEVKLEKLGTTGKREDKVFENQRIIFP